MKVVLLAAGRSKRMKPIEDKNLLNFFGKALIWHQIERIKSVASRNFLIVCNSENVQRINEIARQIKDIQLETVIQHDLEAGMAGALLACKEKIGDEEILVVSTNDLISRQGFKLILEAATNSKDEVFILGKKMESYFPGGYLDVDSKLRLKSIVEKPKPGLEPSDFVNLVIHYFRNSIHLLQFLESARSEKDDRYEVAIDKMIKNGVKIKVVLYDGEWYPIKYPWHIFSVANYLFAELPKSISKKAQISPKAVIKGEVIIEDGARVLDGAILNGPCYLGKETIVANNALVRDSFIGASGMVGYGSEIARSFIGNDCWFHTNYIGDSIIGNNCSFGSGAVTANLRLDGNRVTVPINGEKVECGSNKLGAIVGDNVRVGVNASLMPGIRIGQGSWIASGIVIGENVEPKKYVSGKWLLKVQENLRG